MRVIGLLALLVAIVISLYSAYSFYLGNKAKPRKGEQQQRLGSLGMVWQFVSVTFAGLTLLLAFINNDFSFGYVAQNSAPSMSVFYRIAAFWAGHEGSLLLWLWMLAGYTAVLAFSNMKKNDSLKSQALNISNYVQLFLTITIIVATNPFKGPIPEMNGMGAGMNPLLMHWAMVLHPPTLFMGYAGMTIPFAFAIAALINKDASRAWVDRAYKWTLFGWLFLTIGIFLGALWAYVVLGWGGYWGWDPVENASILPWLTGTALLHTFTMYRRRGGMKVWAVWLASLSFIMVIMATFITRSGLLSAVSVHSFPEIRWDLTFLFGGLMLTVVILTAYLANTRRKELEAQEFFQDFFSRHFTYYLNNVALTVFTFIILGATVIPAFVGATVGASFYNALAKPLGAVYLLLIVICPFLGWTKTEPGKLLKHLAIPAVSAVVLAVPLYLFGGTVFNFAETLNGSVSFMDTLGQVYNFILLVVPIFAIVAVLELFYITASARAKGRGVGFFTGLVALFRFNRSTAGGFVGHLGIAIMMFGIAGSQLYVQDIPATIKNQPGQVVQVSNYELTFKGIKESQKPGEYIANAIFDMKNRSTGKFMGQVAPEFIYHELQQNQTTKAAIHYEPFRDIFVVFNGTDQSTGDLSLNIKVNPLISFVWIGSFLLALGTMVSMWPKAVAVTEEAEDEVDAKKPKKKVAGKRKEALAGAE
ncbi:MAG: heme lyase CcmF/NrfE family subunit [Candidatus Aquicultor sp.]